MIDRRGGGFWLQEQGLALFMVLNRLDGGAWMAAVIGKGSKSGAEFLEAVLGVKAGR